MMQPFAGQLATVECLDLAIERRADLPTGSPVLSYTFGNRCDHPVVVDLLAASVQGHTADGRQIALNPYDPQYEIEVLRLDGRLVGHEAIAYTTDTQVRDICVDAASVAHSGATWWLCPGAP